MLFLVVMMTFEKKVLYCLYWSIIAFWTVGTVGTFDMVEVFVKAYVAGAQLEQK